MDHLFRPWRFAYVTAARPPEGCVLCRIGSAAPEGDRASYVVTRERHHFVVLNVFPYNTGHLMIVPYAHVASLEELPAESLHEMAELARRAESALRAAYRPEGLNVGMNLGTAAGAGIAEHLHLHVVPRWNADTNFMTVAGESRVLPESLAETWAKLAGKL
jgi:ATP adenylyltransferase